ncbi:RHS repeat-associated core domain-containing protein [Nonomuraea solani]|uniref:RHS repeat-associated core domain-containing protein n=1 Tax=Nonomuraea solani TaxID=1144553 RepID=A0A1H6DMT7_9ACTN|nr:RHS repeat-associated core domain-containing protein [Nonomuraea solani]SEG86016.1 RHS repeat-associated core domain-containing protein [Nonomuraea solani]
MTVRGVMTRVGTGPVRRLLSLGLTPALVAGLLVATPTHGMARAATQAPPRPVDHEIVVPGTSLKVTPRKETPRAPDPVVRWPAAGEAEVTLGGETRARQAGDARRAGELPIWVSAPEAPATATQARGAEPGKVRVRMLDHAAATRAGVSGVVFTVSQTGAQAGKVGLRLDYSGFAEAFGGAFGSRVRLVGLPACALTTPDLPGCRTATPLQSANDTRAKTVAADIDTAAEPAVFAAAAGAESSKGDYKATELAASATWQVGTQTGDFAWSYPLRMPPVPGGLTPALGVAYSSSSIDGRTSSSNNQGSQVGDGFDLWPGYIERKYRSCKDDGVPKDDTYDVHPMDQCWGYDNAVMTLGGKGGELVQSSASEWRLRKDDGTRIKKVSGSGTDTANGDDNNEYWVVTAPDGKRFYFGKNRMKGWGSGKAETKSTWTVPIFGNDSGEPCHDDTFAKSWCQQAWRWNLDYVEDPHGNAIVYYYEQEGNRYGRNLRAEDDTPYVRGGYLKSVEYGLNADNPYPASAPARVDFKVAERCLRSAEDCAESKIDDHPAYWEDVPWDLNCKAGTKCEDYKGASSPTFWTRKRVVEAATKVIQSDGSGHRPVDSWSFTHDWGTADVDRQLLLKSIVHTGHAGPAPVVMPPLSFAYTQMANRVDTLGDDVGPFIKNRVGSISNETGGVLDVNYSRPDCRVGDTPSPSSNHRRCFPVLWERTSGDAKPTLDWFHKYVVTQLAQTDLTGGSPDMVTAYDYTIGNPAWHFADDDGLTKEKYRTWSQYQGFDKVRVRSGTTSAAPTQTDHWFFQGMDGDRLNADGGVKKVTVSDGEGGSYPDHESLQGMTLKTITYAKADGEPVAKSMNKPWHHQTASRTRTIDKSTITVTANLTGVGGTRTLKKLDNSWRETRSSVKAFNLSTGAPSQVDDEGDLAVTGDEKCVTTTFTPDGDRVLAKPAQVRTVARRCADTPDLAKDLISDERTTYDNGTFKGAPTLGDATLVEKAKQATATTVTPLAVARTTYDAYGRPETVTDAAGRTTTTKYTESHGLTTKTEVISPPATAGDTSTSHTTVKVLDPAWGSPVSDTDAGGKTTTVHYNAAGHLIKVWLGGRPSSAVPDKEFDYLIRRDAVVAVSTKSLTAEGDQELSYTLYDGWLRLRQLQAAGRDGTAKGRLISDTFYNAAGQVDRTYEAYYADGEPRPEVFGVADPGKIETQHVYEYDGQGRKTADRLLVGSSDVQEKWRTSYEYGGNWSKVIPPPGGTPVTTFADAHDRKTEVREHRTAGHVATLFRYDHRGLESSVTGPGGHVWTTTYDLRGRKIQTSDPDKGVTKFAYNDLDQLVLTEDSRGKKLSVTYDGIGRRIGLYDATAASPGVKVAEWVYDTVRRGQPTSSTRIVGTARYTTQVDIYDNLNRPTRRRILLPDTEGALAPEGGYVFDTSYNLDGSVKASSSPAAGDLPAENTAFTYDDLGRLVATASNLSTYLVGVDYTKTGKQIGQRLSIGAAGKQVDQTFTYEHGTQRLQKATTAHAGTAGTDRSVEYRYTDSGNLLQAVDTSRDGVDNQCFRYDDLQRLVDAWTQEGSACAADPGQATISGLAPYRVNYTYDDTGNRTGETHYGAGPSGGAQSATRGYRYAGNPGVDPKYKGHQLAEVSGNPESYGYDPMGNTTERRTSSGNQTLHWDAEGELVKVVDDKKGETTFLYTADGERLLRRDPAGTTLYLPDLEVRLAKGQSTAKAARYSRNAMRTSAGVTFLVNDHHGTAELAINATDGSVSRRRYTPFGQIRADKGQWPTGNERGFVGGIVDSTTDLTTLGARGYDPNTGRFVSVDPEIEMGRSQQMNGYNYADNNPTTLSDPDGRFPYVNYYVIGVRQYWVRYGNYDYLRQKVTYLVHVWLNFFTHYFYRVTTAWYTAARRWAYLQGPVEPGKKPLLRQPGIPDLTPRTPEPKPPAPSKPKGSVGRCVGLVGKLTASFGIEGCVVFDSQGIGLAATYKKGMSTGIGFDVTASDMFKKGPIEKWNTTPNTWDRYYALEYARKGVGLGFAGVVVTDSDGNLKGGGYEVSGGASHRVHHFTEDQARVRGTFEQGRTKAVRLRNPADIVQEGLWATYNTFKGGFEDGMNKLASPFR